jgi:hypothetical protein
MLALSYHESCEMNQDVTCGSLDGGNRSAAVACKGEATDSTSPRYSIYEQVPATVWHLSINMYLKPSYSSGPHH